MTTGAASLPLHRAFSTLAAGTHVCSIDEPDSNPVAVAAGFVRNGLERREQCVYVAEEDRQGRIRRTFREAGIDVDAALQSRALVLLSPRQTPLRGDAGDPYRFFRFWKKLAAQACQRGFSALRGAVDMQCAVPRTSLFHGWLEYERQLTSLAEESRCSLLCQYARRFFPAGDLLHVVRSHPLVIHHGTLGQNIYHTATAEAAEVTLHASVLDSLLGDIRGRGHADSPLRQQLIEERRQIEELRRREAYLVDGQRISHTGSWGWEIASKEISFWSLELFRILGLDPKVKPTYALLRPLMHPDDRCFIEAAFARAVRARVEFEHEFRITRPDGTLRYLRSYGHPVFDARHRLIEYAGTIIDCTPQREAEAALRATQAQLARVARLMTLGELTASIAHEVNQPLAAIIAFADSARRWLQMAPPDVHEADVACLSAVESARRAREVIDRIRLLAGKAESLREPLAINAVMEEAIALSRGELRQHNVNLRTDFGRDLPPVSGDRVQLQQVGLNLIVNAVEAISLYPESSRELSISTWRDDQELHVAVEDSGIGVPGGDMQSIFEPFYTTKPHGIGIGLSISRSIIQAHGGRLWIEPNADAPGVTARFVLPLVPQERGI